MKCSGLSDKVNSLYYELAYVAQHPLPGMRKFGLYQSIYKSRYLGPVDRTGTIKFPVNVTSLYPLPPMCNFTKGYAELCDERAQALLAFAEQHDTALYVLWSGGVDSTCVLAALLKNATQEQRERLVVLLTEESIYEYPEFYRDHIRGKLRRVSATIFPSLIGEDNLIVTGEYNDQLFGSDIIAKVINNFGIDSVNQPYDRELFTSFFQIQLNNNREDALWYTRLFERVIAAAPIPLKTNQNIFWWINFTIKWQSINLRMLSYVTKRNVPKLSKEYLNNYFVAFFCTDDFQLWSMNNAAGRMPEGWRSYKWQAKDFIYDFTGDADYRDNKIKRGSLFHLTFTKLSFTFIDENFNFHEHLTPEQFYLEDNDFI